MSTPDALGTGVNGDRFCVRSGSWKVAAPNSDARWGGTDSRIGSSRRRRSVRSPMHVEASRLSIPRVSAYEEA
jgi:hypothetical protein